jgi:hypothetical protein
MKDETVKTEVSNPLAPTTVDATQPKAQIALGAQGVQLASIDEHLHLRQRPLIL